MKERQGSRGHSAPEDQGIVGAGAKSPCPAQTGAGGEIRIGSKAVRDAHFGSCALLARIRYVVNTKYEP